MLKQFTRLTTPAGIAKWAWVSKADTKYNSDGEFKVTLVLEKDAAEPLINKIEKELKEFYAGLKAQGKKKIKEAVRPYGEEVDDEGDPTGNVEFKFKSKAKFVPRIPVFDSSGKPMTNVDVWSGSKIKVNTTLAPYSAGIGEGLSMRLNAVQVIDLVRGTNGTAEGYGFGEEDGYVHEDEEPSMEEEITISEEVEDEGDF
tara:strand:+ start:1731 stop:2330 length:600 start_codon:yes stop_codon:yes gene_type:complete